MIYRLRLHVRHSRLPKALLRLGLGRVNEPRVGDAINIMFRHDGPHGRLILLSLMRYHGWRDGPESTQIK